MNPRDFDDILKNKLKDLNPLEGSRPNWDRMERAIEEDSLKDQAFDEQVKRKLNQITIPSFVPANWDNLYELISTRIRRKNAVLSSKAFEIAIIALLFFTSYNMGLWEKEYQPIQYALDSSSIPVDINKAKDSEIIIASIESTPSQSNLVANTSVKRSTNTSISNRVNTEEIVALITATEKHNNQVVAAQNTIDLLKNQSKAVTPVNFSATSGVIPVSASIDLTNNTLDISAVEINTALIAGPKVQNINLSNSIELNLPIVQKVSAFKKPKWFVATSMNLQSNTIKSGLKESFARTRSSGNIDPLQKAVRINNYTILAEVGRKVNKLAISTGFEYQQIEYSPSIELTTGSLSSNLLETSVQALKYDFFSIPLNVSYDLFSSKGWSIALNSGLSINALARSQQDIDQKIIKGTRIIDVNEKDVDRSVLNFSFQEGILDEPNISAKRVWNSTFYRAKIGVGINKQLGRNMSIFTNLNYNHQLPSFQQESSDFEIDDKIQSVSFGIGIRQFFG